MQKRLIQEQVEELADLGTNIKINTLENVIKALDSDIATFFDIMLKDEDSHIAALVSKLKNIPKEQQKEILSTFDTIIKHLKLNKG